MPTSLAQDLRAVLPGVRNVSDIPSEAVTAAASRERRRAGAVPFRIALTGPIAHQPKFHRALVLAQRTPEANRAVAARLCRIPACAACAAAGLTAPKVWLSHENAPLVATTATGKVLQQGAKHKQLSTVVANDAEHARLVLE